MGLKIHCDICDKDIAQLSPVVFFSEKKFFKIFYRKSIMCLRCKENLRKLAEEQDFQREAQKTANGGV